MCTCRRLLATSACPTGALTNKPINNVPIRPREELRQVDTVCPYCGVGCALTFNVDDERQGCNAVRALRAGVCLQLRGASERLVLRAQPDGRTLSLCFEDR